MGYQYDDYIKKHKEAVSQAYQWLFDNLPEVIQDITDANYILNHDSSKSTKEEYDAYDAYFYGNNVSYAVKEEFDKAWLHHIHHNPHHWQHWILFEDDPVSGEPYKCLEMPINYIVEMICDWWSFSFRSGDLTEMFDWYEKHKEIIKLHPKSRKIVEDILGRIREKLDSLKKYDV